MPISKAQMQAVSRYTKKNYDNIQVRVPKGRLAAIKAYTESKGESVNGYINGLIREDMGFTDEAWKEVAEDE